MAEKWQLKAVLSANAEALVKALGDVGRVAKTTRKYLLDVGKSAGNLSGRLGLPFAALSGILGGLSAIGIKNAIVGFTDLGGVVSKGAVQAGMTTDEFQRMKYVAEQSETSIEALGASMGKLNRNAGDAAAGKNKNLAALFQRLGITVRGANGEVRRGIDMLPELADAFKRNENPAVRARMGVALFGKSWQEIAPLLVDGSEGINQNLERLSRLKGVIPAEDIRGAKELGDRFKDLDLVFTGFKMTIAKELAPVIGPLVEQLTAWWVANKKLVSVEVAKMAREFGDWVRSIDFKAVIAGVQDFCKNIGQLVDWLGGAKNALIALVVFMNLQTIAALFGLIASVGRAVWWFGSLAWAAGVKAFAGLTTYTTATTAAEVATTGLNVSAGRLLGTLGAISAAAAPLAAIWGVSEWAGDTSHDQERTNTLRGWSDSLASMLPDWMGDPSKGARERYLANRDNLIGADQAKVGGEITVRFENAPAGMRVNQGDKTGPVALNTDVGYRSFALGMP